LALRKKRWLETSRILSCRIVTLLYLSIKTISSCLFIYYYYYLVLQIENVFYKGSSSGMRDIAIYFVSFCCCFHIVLSYFSAGFWSWIWWKHWLLSRILQAIPCQYPFDILSMQKIIHYILMKLAHILLVYQSYSYFFFAFLTYPPLKAKGIATRKEWNCSSYQQDWSIGPNCCYNHERK